MTQGRRALVTGAARGIGAATAARLTADGFEVVTLDLREGCDIVLDVARDEFPPLDVEVCVANAGVTTTIAPAHRMSAEQWQRDIDVNLTGAFRTVQACLGGCATAATVGSWSSRALPRWEGCPGRSRMPRQRPGSLGWSERCASENASRGITVNAILPGLVATEQVLAMPDEVRERALGVLPTGRAVSPRRSPPRSRSWQARRRLRSADRRSRSTALRR